MAASVNGDSVTHARSRLLGAECAGLTLTLGSDSTQSMRTHMAIAAGQAAPEPAHRWDGAGHKVVILAERSEDRLWVGRFGADAS